MTNRPGVLDKSLREHMHEEDWLVLAKLLTQTGRGRAVRPGGPALQAVPSCSTSMRVRRARPLRRSNASQIQPCREWICDGLISSLDGEAS
jgi:hypothetical protein